MSRRLKTIAVILGSVAVTTLGINASDFSRGVEDSLSALVGGSASGCGPHAVRVLWGSGALCVDQYEASADPTCPHEEPQNELESIANVNDGRCLPRSEPAVTPWRFVSLTQAQQVCARAGKRLLTADEWYRLAVGIADVSTCSLDVRNDQPVPTGASSCVSPQGVHDLVGSVWEWMDETVVDGTYDGRTVPASGYVAAVDAAGVVIRTDAAPPADFGDDYAWTNDTGVFGIIRGGFYGSGSDGGLFAQNLAVSTELKTAGIGFRCVRDIE